MTETGILNFYVCILVYDHAEAQLIYSTRKAAVPPRSSLQRSIRDNKLGKHLLQSCVDDIEASIANLMKNKRLKIFILCTAVLFGIAVSAFFLLPELDYYYIGV